MQCVAVKTIYYGFECCGELCRQIFTFSCTVFQNSLPYDIIQMFEHLSVFILACLYFFLSRTRHNIHRLFSIYLKRAYVYCGRSPSLIILLPQQRHVACKAIQFTSIYLSHKGTKDAHTPFLPSAGLYSHYTLYFDLSR